MRAHAAIAAALATLLLVPSAVTAAPGDEVGTDPWGPYGWDEASERFHQPRLATPIPDPEPLGALDQADFDHDGVPNLNDNCLLVPNPRQQPATPPASEEEWRAYRERRGPADLLELAERWEAENPGARFRTDAELGEACSGYNDNYLRTTKALIAAPNQLQLDSFRFLGASGPMFGGAADPFPTGKPTAYDRFGSVPGPTGPSPTGDADLPRDADGELARGNLAPSMPMCSGYEQYAGFVRWLTGTEGIGALDELSAGGRAAYESGEDRWGCGSALQRPAWEAAMHHFWAGKRLYTDAEGGRITNRFVASITEHPLYRGLVTTEPFKTFAQRSGMHPYSDDPEAAGQTRHGIIFRGRSYVDGREAILMDWRGFEAAWPLTFTLDLGLGEGMSGGMLIYDECRAIQTGVYNCTAVVDGAIGPRRHTFQEGYMPWVLKGPPSIEHYLQAVR